MGVRDIKCRTALELKLPCAGKIGEKLPGEMRIDWGHEG